MEYALLQKNAVHNLTTRKSAYMVVTLVKANKTNYQFTTSPVNILYCDVQKRKVYTSNVYFILQSVVGLGWEYGRVGEGRLIHHGH